MTSLDEQLVDSIVAGVLDRLRRTSAPAQASGGRKSPESNPVATSHTRVLSDHVITEAVLEAKLNGARTVRFSPKAVLTPTARDYLRINKIDWSVAEHATASATKPSKTWAAVIVSATSAVERSLADMLPTARKELLSCPDDAATFVISELSRGGFDGMIVFAKQTHRTACLANRHAAVKAVAVRDAAEVQAVRRQLRANVWCLDPSGKTYFELRNILKAIAAG
jgi:hypothetical protein